jgi:hypothetical protein
MIRKYESKLNVRTIMLTLIALATFITILIWGQDARATDCPQEVLIISGVPYNGFIGPIEYVDGLIPNLTFHYEEAHQASILCTKLHYRDTMLGVTPEIVDWIVDAGAYWGQISSIAKKVELGELDDSVDHCRHIVKEILVQNHTHEAI